MWIFPVDLALYVVAREQFMDDDKCGEMIIEGPPKLFFLLFGMGIRNVGKEYGRPGIGVKRWGRADPADPGHWAGTFGG